MSPRAHCWQGYLEHLRETLGDTEGEARWYDEGAPPMTCLLWDGHSGPHEWTHDGNITVRFSDGPSSTADDGARALPHEQAQHNEPKDLET